MSSVELTLKQIIEGIMKASFSVPVRLPEGDTTKTEAIREKRRAETEALKRRREQYRNRGYV
jgi:hypothetical protein